MSREITVGTCSICGGRVSLPSVWFGVIPPVPTCDSCGAIKADHGPVITMKPLRQQTTTETLLTPSDKVSGQ